MEKVYKTLACPICNGNDINVNREDTYKREEQENLIRVFIHRNYDCYCRKCQKEYSVDYGNAKLVRYKPFIHVTQDDVKLFVDYESEFDRSYKIAEVNGISMILMEDDIYPVILNKENKEELIDNHDKAMSYTLNTWMNRYR